MRIIKNDETGYFILSQVIYQHNIGSPLPQVLTVNRYKNHNSMITNDLKNKSIGYKKKLRCLFCLLFSVTIFFCNSIQAQVSDLIGLNFGVSNFHIVDDHSSPLIFKGTGIAPSIQYIHKGFRIDHFVDGSFYYDNLSTSASNFYTENFRGRFRYSLFYKPSFNQTAAKRFEFSVGGSVTSFYCKSDYYFDLHSSQARSISSWYWSHSLDFTTMFKYNLSDRDFIHFRVYIPLLSNVSRPEYSSSGGYDYEKNEWNVETFGKTEFFPANFTMNAHLEYQYQIFAHFRIQCGYEFYFATYNKPDQISMYMNNFRLGMFYIIN
jgi:hypothetical protein